jgi:hypothetical protein
MLRRILLVVNPVSLFLVLNIILPKSVSLYDQYNNINQIEYVNIGSSHAQLAFNYSDHPNSINLGIGNQRMYYGLMILESIEQRMDSQSTIIIPVSIFSFCGQYEGPKQRYLGFIPRDRLGISLEEEILAKYFPYLGINRTESLFYFTKNEVKDFNDNGLERAQFHISLAYECNIIDESIVQLARYFIQDNLDKRIIFMITPYLDSYWTPIQQEGMVLNSVVSTIKDLVDDYGLEFYDYSNDSRFNSSKEYFRDSDHMNEVGAKVFTEIFIDEIGRIA